MNIQHLEQIIDHYLNRFEELNGPIYEEYYKWQIAYQFRPLMVEALNARSEDFPFKLMAVKKLTQNVIDSYTQPFNGLVEFSRQEPETVRKMFGNLFLSAQSDVEEKQIVIQNFLDASHRLRDKYFPGSYRYNDDLHSVTGYLFLYDPENNYLFKQSHCRSFADCIEFYSDWGSESDFNLSVFYRMCDEVLMYLKQDKKLMAKNASRYEIDPSGMHPDQEKHILLFDLIYCCTTYGLFQGINYISPKGAERKLIEERKTKALELSEAYTIAQSQFDLLNEAKAWLCKALEPGTIITHKSFGKGSILQADDKVVTVQFATVGQKKLGAVACVANGLICFDEKKKEEEQSRYQNILKNDERVRNAVRMAEKELAPYLQYLD